MKGLWCVIGKAGIDSEFASELYRIISEKSAMNRGGAEQHEDERLNDFLFYENGFMLSRWERGEVMRLMKGIAEKQLLVDLGGFCLESPQPAQPSENFYALLGLCCLDSRLRKSISDTQKSFDRELSVLLGSFRLNDFEIRWLKRFLQREEVVDALRNIHDNFWTQPGPGLARTSCIWSFTHDKNYEHFPPEKFRGPSGVKG